MPSGPRGRWMLHRAEVVRPPPSLHCDHPAAAVHPLTWGQAPTSAVGPFGARGPRGALPRAVSSGRSRGGRRKLAKRMCSVFGKRVSNSYIIRAG
eukprot:gene15380-biopygen18697